MPIPLDEQRFLRSVNAPDHKTCVARANQFCALTGLSTAQFAEELRHDFGRVGNSTMLIYLRGNYAIHNTEHSDTGWMDARVWDFCERHWPKPKEQGFAEPMLETSGSREITRCFEEAVDDGINSLIYGPPSAEKSFVLENLIQQRQSAGKNDAIYVYCDPNISPLALLKRLARDAEAWTPRAWMREQYMAALITAFDSRPYPPALIFDEAQHLTVQALEVIRALHDRTRRKQRLGCGIILAGSHNLFRDFMSPRRRPQLEQWLSRLPNRVQLVGMTREEALEIAARAWGNGKRVKFTAQHEEKILEACRVADPYATDAAGDPLMDEKKRPTVRMYYSARRLLHYIRQQKKNVKAVLAKDALA
jgi:DNA transposition AAA+ family ATPase